MSARKSLTLAESVLKPCMEIAAREIHEQLSVTQVQKLPLSDTTGVHNVSKKLADNFSEYGVTWLKC